MRSNNSEEEAVAARQKLRLVKTIRWQTKAVNWLYGLLPVAVQNFAPLQTLVRSVIDRGNALCDDAEKKFQLES